MFLNNGNIFSNYCLASHSSHLQFKLLRLNRRKNGGGYIIVTKINKCIDKSQPFYYHILFRKASGNRKVSFC